MGPKTKQKSTRSESRAFFGCKVRQRLDEGAVSFFVFYAPAKDVFAWAGVRAVGDSSHGTQRMLRPTRVRAIRRFLEAVPGNVIPNDILLSFPTGVASFRSLDSAIVKTAKGDVDPSNGCSSLEWGVLTFAFVPGTELARRPIQIVDGQHRLSGMAQLEAEDLPTLVVGLLDASREEQAFQFVVINNKATRVPTDNVKALIEGLREAELRERLLVSGVSYGPHTPVLRDVDTQESSPFRGLLDWPANRSGRRLVPLTAIEQSLRYIDSVLPFLNDDEDTRLQVFLAIWSAVKRGSAELWGKEGTFMTKVCITALNEFLSDKLKAAWEFDRCDIFNLEDVEMATCSQVEKIPAQYWTREWGIKIQDNANVRGLIKADLEQIAVNARLSKPWWEGLMVLSAPGWD